MAIGHDTIIVEEVCARVAARTRQAATLNSGILLTGSSARTVSWFAASRSGQW